MVLLNADVPARAPSLYRFSVFPDLTKAKCVQVFEVRVTLLNVTTGKSEPVVLY